MPPKINMPPITGLPKALGYNFGDTFLVEFEDGDKLCMLTHCAHGGGVLVDMATGFNVSKYMETNGNPDKCYDVSIDDFWYGVGRAFEEVRIEINVRR